MARLPQIKPRDIERALNKAGFIPRRGKGSHVVFKYADGRRTVIPGYNSPVRIGTLRAILRQADITVEEFLGLLKRKN